MSKAKIFEFNIEHQMANEIEIMSLLDHPNIIRLEFYFETREELILILEYAALGTLSQLIKRRKKCLSQSQQSQPELTDDKIFRVGYF